MLGANNIADLLDHASDTEDPLIIAPCPDPDELRRRGEASVDLRLGCWFVALKHARAPVLDVGVSLSEELGESTQPRTQLRPAALIKEHFVRFGKPFILHPRSFVLGGTLEWLRLPRDVAGYVTSRSSWGRRGLIIATATGVHPRFTGCLTLELTNVGSVPIALYPGMAVCQLFLHRLHEPTQGSMAAAMAGSRKPSLRTITLDKIERVLLRKSEEEGCS